MYVLTQNNLFVIYIIHERQIQFQRPSYNKSDKVNKYSNNSNKKTKGGRRKTRKSKTLRRRKIRGGGMIGNLFGNFDAGGSLNQLGSAQTRNKFTLAHNKIF